MNVVRRLLRCNRGVSMVEYAILLALIAAIAISAITALGSTTSSGIAKVSCNGLHGDAAHDCSGTGPGHSGNH